MTRPFRHIKIGFSDKVLINYDTLNPMLEISRAGDESKDDLIFEQLTGIARKTARNYEVSREVQIELYELFLEWIWTMIRDKNIEPRPGMTNWVIRGCQLQAMRFFRRKEYKTRTYLLSSGGTLELDLLSTQAVVSTVIEKCSWSTEAVVFDRCLWALRLKIRCYSDEESTLVRYILCFRIALGYLPDIRYLVHRFDLVDYKVIKQYLRKIWSLIETMRKALSNMDSRSDDSWKLDPRMRQINPVNLYQGHELIPITRH
jgi:hypothetical protein